MARSTAAATNVNGDGTESVLGRGTRVRGRIRGDGDLRIEVATIKGDVQASTVTIGGELAGDVTARGAVLVRAGAKVAGNLGGSEISLEEGASFEGRIDAELDLPV